jgi:hypothetical protein
MQRLTLLALISHVGNVAAAVAWPTASRAGSAVRLSGNAAALRSRVLDSPSRDAFCKAFNVTGIVANDFPSFCISTDQSPSGNFRHACVTSHTDRIKRATGGS